MKIGFIGCGNMATAMISGIIARGITAPEDVMASDKSRKMLEKIENEKGITAFADNTMVAEEADVLVLAIKPQFMEDVIREIRDVVREETVIVTLAPGKTLSWVEEQFGRPISLVRSMPNTPAMVGAGMSALCPNERVSKEQLEIVRSIYGSFGRCAVVSEKMIEVVTGVSGSGPAYVFLFIEAMADAAVAEGMPRADAYQFAAQAVMGSAKMVLETGRHPGDLKDAVCSPGGTTIEAVRVLEEKGFRSAVMEAVLACIRKGREL